MKKFIYCLVVAVVTTGLLLGCAPTPPPEEAPSPTPVVLKAAIGWPADTDVLDYFWKFTEFVEAKSKGELIIEAVGPEAIPSFQQLEATRTGVVDITATCSGYHEGEMPEAAAFQYSDISPSEERAIGFFDFMDRLYREKVGVMYLGRQCWPMPFNWYSKVRLQKMEDFKGINCRVSPVYEPFGKALGMNLISIPFAEIYTAMERGVADAFGWGNFGWLVFGWVDVTKYVIDPPFYQANFVMLMNIDSWNKLPKHLQKVIEDSVAQMEQEMVPYFREVAVKEREKMIEAGLEVITVDEPDKYIKLSREMAWETFKQRSPVIAPEVEKMIRR